MGDLRDNLAGKFIVLDGPDGSGKSTQVKLLAEFLTERGVKVCPVRDPGGTAIGDKIRAILLDKAHDEMCVQCELMLYMASRAQLVSQIIRPALQSGQCVLSDRYVSSTIAYQGAGGVHVPDILAAAKAAVGGLWPALTILLDMPPETGLARLPAAPDRMESKNLEFHQRVRALYLQQALQSPAKYAIVDAVGTIESVQKLIRRVFDTWKW